MEIKFYCPAPWYGVFVTPTYSSVCCSHSGIKTNGASSFFADDHIKDIRHSFITGNLDRDCKGCQHTSAVGGYSLATKFKDLYTEAGIKFDPVTDMSNIDTPLNPEYLELRFSNHCNFSCRMCFPSFSNRLGEEVIDYPELKQLYHEKEFGLTSTSSQFIHELLQRVDQYKWINITGGEPMLMPEVIQFLDQINELGKVEQITLHITTNVSTINQRIIDRLKNFKKVILTLSIDAIGKSAEYIRHGTVWSHIDRNLNFYNNLGKEFPNIAIGVNMTLSAYSLFGLDETFKYLSQWRNSNFQWIGGNLSQGAIEPYHLGGVARTKAIEELAKAIELLPNLMPNKEDIKTLISQLVSLKTVLETQQANKDVWSSLVRRTQMVDDARNQKFQSVYGFELNS